MFEELPRSTKSLRQLHCMPKLDEADNTILVANAHNMLIRCLNSIYLQAPYVKEEGDIQDLLQYSLFW
jgi:hypothetical protein